MFEARPFMLGGRPSLADFGLFACMFRYGAPYPTPSLLMLMLTRTKGTHTFYESGNGVRPLFTLTLVSKF